MNNSVCMYVVWREKYVTRITYYNIITFNDAHKDPGDRLKHYKYRSRVCDGLGDYLLYMTTTWTIYNIYICNIGTFYITIWWQSMIVTYLPPVCNHGPSCRSHGSPQDARAIGEPKPMRCGRPII